jgi:3-dehydroquinate synthase
VLQAAVSSVEHDRLFVVCDRNSRFLCLPLVSDIDCMKDVEVITLDEGDEHKTLEYVEFVWTELQKRGATRHSLVVNIGGGMVTDLAGFAVSTFKRGLPFINIPTTLLAMVDASVGGKTGFNYGGLKNEIGVFRNAEVVIIDTIFLKTLDNENILSGYAEMLKHGLIDSSFLTELLNFDIENPDLAKLGRMVADSVAVKQHIVTEDPTEHGLRKALNLGHTVGHAFEALALERRKPVLHGYAVAWGLVCELYLSVVKTDYPVERMRQLVRFVLEHYGRMTITCDDYPRLIELMTHDKKNTAGQINFTLLGNAGDIRINQTATKAEIEEALDFYREGQ